MRSKLWGDLWEQKRRRNQGPNLDVRESDLTL